MMRMTDRLLGFLAKRSRRTMAVSALILTGLLGVLDFLTGYEISFGVFYLLPVSLSAWYVSSRYGFTMSILTAATWLGANALTDPASERSAPLLIWNATTRLGFFLVTTLLLTRLRQALERERLLARTDGLTGLLNVRAFDEAGTREVERSRRYHYPLSVIFLDLDDFKSINDLEGHKAGDDLLVELARILKTNLRSSDIIGRLGGDEFVVLLPETDGQAGLIICEKLETKISEGLRARNWPITCSMGIVTAEEEVQEISALLKEADRLLYQVKAAGKKGHRQNVISART
jgi:diguanylate cyclase (GGDEF)-like protein